MKLLYYSSDSAEVDQVSRECTGAGIPCEVRKGPNFKAAPREAELWIQKDKDSHRAFLLCVQLGIGFARRQERCVDLDSD